MNLENAVAFVRHNGYDVECARLDYLLTGKQPSHNIIAQLFSDQRPDGGWAPFWAGDYSSLDATCFRLAKAEQLGIHKAETAVKRAVDFLERRQAADGSWQEDETVTSIAPPWAAPGDLAATLYLTANCAFWLALFGTGDDKARQAARFLEAHLSEEGQLPSFLHTHWLAGGLWHQLDRQVPAERVFEYLSGKIDDLTPSNLSWLMTTLSAAGVARNEPLLNKAASLLERAQDDDGPWRSEDGSGQDVHATLEALRALRFVGITY